jgi:hypothetical protein
LMVSQPSYFAFSAVVAFHDMVAAGTPRSFSEICTQTTCFASGIGATVGLPMLARGRRTSP